MIIKDLPNMTLDQLQTELKRTKEYLKQTELEIEYRDSKEYLLSKLPRVYKDSFIALDTPINKENFSPIEKSVNKGILSPLKIHEVIINKKK